MLAVFIILVYISGIIPAYFVVKLQNMLFDFRKMVGRDWIKKPSDIGYIFLSWVYIAVVIYFYICVLLYSICLILIVIKRNIFENQYPGLRK